LNGRSRSPWRFAAVGFWVLLWLLPWQELLGDHFGLRAALGFVLFILPGALLQQWIVGERGVARFLTVGFCVSVALVGLLGLVARLAHLSIEFVRVVLMLIGALGILGAWRDWSLPKGGLRSRLQQVAVTLPLLVALGFALQAAHAESGKTDIDFATHHAQVTEFRDADELGFGHFVFGPEVGLSKRFWLSYWTLAQAVVAKNAGLHIIELYPWLQKGVLLLAVLAGFALARRMGLSLRWACLAAVVQLASVSALWGETEGYRVGLTFYKYTLLDNNVATHLSGLVLLRVLVDFLAEPGRRGFALLFLVAVGLLFTHPGMLGLFGVLLGIYIALQVLERPWSKAEVAALALLALVSAIPASLRFVAVNQVLPTSLSEMIYPPRAVKVLEDGVHYGVDPSYAMYLPFAFVAVAAVVAMFHAHRSPLARYILAAVLFLAICITPQTATLLGSAVTPTILGRSLWFMPFGLAAGFVAMVLFGWAARRFPMAGAFGYVVLSLLALAWMADGIGSEPREHRDEIDYTTAQYLEVARALDELLSEPTIVLGDRTFNSHLPTLSANAKSISHRTEAQFFRVAYLSRLGAFDRSEARQRIDTWTAIANERTASRRRVVLLRQSGARYFVSRKRFDAGSRAGLAPPPGLEEVRAAPGFHIYRVLPP